MTYVHHKMSNGTLRDIVREDAIQMRDPSRHYCPTTEATKYVDTWEDAKAAGMEVCFNEDQTEINLRLPAPYKFSIRFQRER